MRNLLIKTLESNKEAYLQKLIELVNIKTEVIGHGIDGGFEKKGQEYLANLLEQIGAESITRDQMDEKIIEQAMVKYNEGNPGHHYKDRYNLYATFKGTGDKSILFNGHIDTMPPGDISLWDNNPYVATLNKNILTGLGVCDMKAGLMASILAVDLIKKAGIVLPSDVIIASVVDEEGGGNGSIQAAMNGIKADAAVVCEPTANDFIMAHMGFVFFNVEIKGKAVHSGSKLEGVNAIEKAYFIMDAINQLEHSWLMTYKHPLLPAPTSNFGVIEGGSAGSTVPDCCVFKTCVHYLPGKMSHNQTVAQYTNAIMTRAQGDEWLRENPPKVSIYQAGGGFEMEIDHEFTEIFTSAFGKILKRKHKITASPAGCDSRVWKNMAGIPTIQFGPGKPWVAHTTNECIDVEEYFDAILVYAQLILDWSKE